MPSSPAPVSPFSAADAEADVVASSVRSGRTVLESLPPMPPMPKPSSIKHLRVDQLRAELEALGLDDTSGLKRELQDRLLEAQLLKWHALFEQRDAALRAMIGKAKRKAEKADRKAEEADRKAEEAGRKADRALLQAKKNEERNAVLGRFAHYGVVPKLNEHDVKIAYLADKVGLNMSGIDKQMERERDGVDSIDGSEEEADGSGTVEEGSDDGEE